MLNCFSHFFRVALVWVLLAATAFPMWEESQSKQISSEVQSPKKTEVLNSSDRKIQARQERDVSIGFYLLIIMGIAGVTFAIMVVMWGSHVRRITRKRVSKQTLVDPLWYLKSNKTQETPKKMDSETQTPNPDNRNLEST
jgi:hypothetical protein